jgi:hypothetical protein
MTELIMNFMQLLLATLLLTAFISCGGYDDDDNPPPQEEQTQEGTFRGTANAVNPDVTSSNAAIGIRIEADIFAVEVFGTGPTTTHIQYINEGTRCPTLAADDTNQDGVIDVEEGAAVYGRPLVPLDSELAAVGGVFPSAVAYEYTQSASVTEMVNNLNLQGLDVEGKAFTIHGIPGLRELL